MTFTHPEYLWFLLAVLIPIIIHLINLRKPKVILFSNIQIVKEIQEDIKKKVKLKDLLLLFLRIMFIVFVVIATANPVYKDSKSSTSNSSVVIIIDNSYSMMSGDAYGAYLQQAKNIAEQIIKGYPNTTEFNVMSSGNPKFNAHFITKKKALEKIPAILPTIRTHSLQYILNKTDKLFRKSKNPARELYFISDFQKETVINDSVEVPQGIKINLIKIGENSKNNLYVKKMEFVGDVLAVNTPLPFNIVVKNSGNVEAKSVPLRILVGKQVKGRATLNIPPNQTQNKTITFSNETGGWKYGFVEIKDLNLTFDNKLYFSYQIKDKIKVGIFGNKIPQGLKNLMQIFGSQFSVSYESLQNFSTQAFDKYEVIFIIGSLPVSDAIITHLTQWLKKGYGITIIPEDEKDVLNFRELSAKLQLGEVKDVKEHSEPITLKKPPLESPFYKNVFQKETFSGDFNSPLISKLIEFYPNPGKKYEILVQTIDKKPFIVRFSEDKGQIFLFTSAFAWNTLERNDFFVPLIHRIVMLSGSRFFDKLYIRFDENEQIAIKNQSPEIIKLRSLQDSSEIIPEQYQQGNEKILKFGKNTIAPGIYEMLQKDKNIGYLAFNTSVKESEMQFLDINKLQELFSSYENVSVMQGTSVEISDYVSSQVSGTSLVYWFLLLALLMLLLEMAVAKFV